jgi:hypothetical protein
MKAIDSAASKEKAPDDQDSMIGRATCYVQTHLQFILWVKTVRTLS